MEQTNEMTYTQAVTELEQLVQKMQDPQCSIDNLSEYTRRSKQLLDICRKKLTAADEQLKQILADIQANNAYLSSSAEKIDRIAKTIHR